MSVLVSSSSQLTSPDLSYGFHNVTAAGNWSTPVDFTGNGIHVYQAGSPNFVLPDGFAPNFSGGSALGASIPQSPMFFELTSGGAFSALQVNVATAAADKTNIFVGYMAFKDGISVESGVVQVGQGDYLYLSDLNADSVALVSNNGAQALQAWLDCDLCAPRAVSNFLAVDNVLVSTQFDGGPTPAVPEPSSIALVAAAGLAMAAVRGKAVVKRMFGKTGPTPA